MRCLTSNMRAFRTRHGVFSFSAAAIVCLCSLLPQATATADVRPLLKTTWTDDAKSSTIPLPEYPRPQMVRHDWLNLNGDWDYMGGRSLVNPAEVPRTPPEFSSNSSTIKVPFPPESYLSGIMRDLEINMWYRREFNVPSAWLHSRTLLHFGAVAESAAVYVNGHLAGKHHGRWESFSFDITALIHPGNNTLTVGAHDPHDGLTSAGKNVIEKGDYVFTSGIWQTVWLEPVPETSLRDLTITPNLDESTVTVTPHAHGMVGSVSVSVLEGRREVVTGTGKTGTDIVLVMHLVREWSPDDPFLYDLRVRLLDDNGKTVDEVQSYFGMRSIALGHAHGYLRPLLNGKFVFQLGPLDQGYWPDGIQTPPTDDAIRHDLSTLKDLGFNMVRKHAKVEPQRWYYLADKLGLLVWQDMPSMWYPDDQPPSVRAQFEQEWETIIQQHYNSPAIVVWVPFNENWGAYDAHRITSWTKTLDPSRLVSGNSGYNARPPYRPAPGDPGNGDFDDRHQYPGPGDVPQPSQSRAAALGEYGGVGLLVPGHMWPGKHDAYEMQPTVEALTSRFESIQEDLIPFIRDQGLGAAVYTQVSDVEHEVNGILTYDRKVRKIDFDRARAAITGAIEATSDSEAYKKDL